MIDELYPVDEYGIIYKIVFIGWFVCVHMNARCKHDRRNPFLREVELVRCLKENFIKSIASVKRVVYVHSEVVETIVYV